MEQLCQFFLRIHANRDPVSHKTLKKKKNQERKKEKYIITDSNESKGKRETRVLCYCFKIDLNKPSSGKYLIVWSPSGRSSNSGRTRTKHHKGNQAHLGLMRSLTDWQLGNYSVPKARTFIHSQGVRTEHAIKNWRHTPSSFPAGLEVSLCGWKDIKIKLLTTNH